MRWKKKGKYRYKAGPTMVCENCGQDAFYCDGPCTEDFIENQKIICKEAGASQHFCRDCYKPSKVKVLKKRDNGV